MRNSSAAEFVLPNAGKTGTGVVGMFALRQLLDTGADGLRQIAHGAGMSLSDLAYRYCRHQAGIDVVLTGTGDPAHLQANIAAALAPPLPESVLACLERWSADQAEGASTRK
jgi:aryl-alcohol dehydrogenase-like predicted oxidoreductase